MDLSNIETERLRLIPVKDFKIEENSEIINQLTNLLILILARNNTTFAVFSAPVIVTQLPSILPYPLATGNKHRNIKSTQNRYHF